MKRTWQIPALSFLLAAILVGGTGCAKKDSPSGPSGNNAPVITFLQSDATQGYHHQQVTILCSATDPDGDRLHYSWYPEGGELVSLEADTQAVWRLPDDGELGVVRVEVSDGKTNVDSTITVELLQVETFSHVYGVDLHLIGRSLLPLEDGRFVVVAQFGTYGEGDIRIKEYSADGSEELWSTPFAYHNSTNAYQIIRSAPGGFLVTGDGSHSPMRKEMYVLHLSAEGGRLWNNSYGTGQSTGSVGIVANVDGGATIAGVQHNQEGHSEPVVARVHNDGTLAWYREYTELWSTSAFAHMVEAGDGITVGGLHTTPSVYHNYLQHLDQDGNVVWERNYETSDPRRQMTKLLYLQDGTYFTLGRTMGTDVAVPWIAHFSDEGELLTETILEYDIHHIGTAVCQLRDGNIVFTGTREDFETIRTGFFVEVTPDCEVVRTKNLSLGGLERLNDVAEASDGGLLFTGTYMGEDYDSTMGMWLLKTDRLGRFSRE